MDRPDCGTRGGLTGNSRFPHSSHVETIPASAVPRRLFASHDTCIPFFTTRKMVTFTCSNCGDSIRKNAVEKHSFRCRFTVITCIDCFQEFRYGVNTCYRFMSITSSSSFRPISRSSYVSHTQCLTEDQRYQGKLYTGKSDENKGQRKQDNWLQVRILSVCCSCLQSGLASGTKEHRHRSVPSSSRSTYPSVSLKIPLSTEHSGLRESGKSRTSGSSGGKADVVPECAPQKEQVYELRHQLYGDS